MVSAVLTTPFSTPFLQQLHALVGLLRVADDEELFTAALNERREVVELAGHGFVRATVAKVGYEHARVDHAQLRQLVVERQGLFAHQVDLRKAALEQREAPASLPSSMPSPVLLGLEKVCQPTVPGAYSSFDQS